ncbi:DUF1254 domain-containing protein [Marinihelvus fidelis]|uniref:DUF1254 domain-containing protein n=1 Tax=Marinihelvus fidelis TaxID=2613842 RepID=A0A5N0TCJ2_9GAMM|nr:DUF1214 domain-containing protein [Marinihelvus fidelis]KAA9131566.1 DUF1254 domain-containing protein [Marinihelvus fidelis]
MNRFCFDGLLAVLMCLALAGCDPLASEAPESATLATDAATSDIQHTEPAVSDDEIVEAWVYLLSRALVVRQEQMDFQGTGLSYNDIRYNEAGKADFVNPNLDVAYMEAWVAIDDDSAVVLEIPEIEGRYYTAQFLDGWGEVVVNINERNFPDHPNGRFALCMAPCDVELPDDVLAVEVPDRKLKMLARVELQDDLDGAIALQKGFRMSVIGLPSTQMPLPLPKFSNQDPPGVELFRLVDHFLETPDTKMDASTIRATARRVAAYVANGGPAAAHADQVINEQAMPRFIQFATQKAGKFENGWLATLTAGNYDGDYWTRAAANFVGIWANTSEEVIYFIASTDGAGETLGDGKAYRLHFTADELPAQNVNGFWSVILVDFPGYRVVGNALDRYNFNNYSSLTYGDDGSLTLYVAPSLDPAWPQSNWLPSPSKGRFNLTLRMYVPKDNVLAGDWFPPPLE